MKTQHIAFGLTGALLFSSASWAVGLEKPVMWSGKYSGLGNAAASSAKGAEALYFNPAGLATAGRTTENDATLDFSPTFTKMTTPVIAPNTATNSNTTFSPVGALLLSHQLMPGLGVGLGIYASGGLALDYGSVTLNPLLQTTLPAELRVALSGMEFALGAGYQVTPMLSIGAAWRISLYSADLATLGADPTDPNSIANNKFLSQTGTNYSGFRFGAQYGSEDGNWGIGAQFRTSVALNASGTGTSYSLYGANQSATALGATQLQTTLPLQFSLGGHYTLMNDLKAFLQYDYTQYVDNRTLNITVGGIVTSQTLDWNNRHNARVGFEYTRIQNWPIRLGYVFTSQVTPNDYPAIIYTGPGPANTITLGTGTLLASNLSLDGALDYTWGNGTGTPVAATAAGPYAGAYNAVAYTAHTGLNYRF